MEPTSWLSPEGPLDFLSWGEECWKQMEWCLQRPGGKNDHEIFSSWLSISGEYGERQEVVKKSPERRAESE